VTGDLITGEARARFQRLFGDGGHGYILPGRPWEWYGHLGVAVDGDGWRIHSPALGHRDAFYGLAGVSFLTSGRASSEVTTARWLRSGRLELHYRPLPAGGTVSVQIDQEAPVEVTTRGEGSIAKQTLELSADAPHTVRLRTKGDGDVTLFGLVLERSGAGVVYDALGSNGGAIHHLALIDRAHWIEALRLRRPDLVILAFGTNESGYYNIPGVGYANDYREVVGRIREALPGASILIMAPMDRGERLESGDIATLPAIKRIVEAQRRIARELGCAFFDTFAAMGGEGAVVRWYQSTPRLMASDFTHPTRSGADALARTLVESLRVRAVASEDAAPSSTHVEQQRPVGETGAEGGEHRGRAPSQ
jgi:lysophospholipase L1-like esterase